MAWSEFDWFAEPKLWNTPVIALTGLAMQDDAKRCLEPHRLLPQQPFSDRGFGGVDASNPLRENRKLTNRKLLQVESRIFMHKLCQKRCKGGRPSPSYKS